MINDLRNIIYSILNKESRGDLLSPVEFNNLVWMVVLQKFNSYLTDYRAAVIKSNRGNASYGLADAPTLMRQFIDVFGYEAPINAEADSPVEYSNFKIPENCAWLEKVFQSKIEITEVERSQWVYLLNSTKVKPDRFNPIFLRVNKGEIRIYPKWYTVNLFYVRFPKKPKWTFHNVNGNPVFNPSANDFQEIELHPSELPDLVYEMCQILGINLQDYQDFQALEVLKDKKYQKENIV